MAAPAYTEDLTDLSLAESTSDGGSWSQIGGGGNIAMGAGPDFAMQGTNCVDAKISNVDRGMAVSHGAFTPGAAEHLFVWLFTSTPGLAAALSSAGVCVVVGTGTTAYVKFHVDGGDTFGARGRVGKCYPVRYRTDATASPPYRTVVGSPGASPSLTGGQWNISGTVKGSNVAVDAIRRGTGAYLTAGELLSAGDGSDNPCTFTGFAAVDNAVANRWGILLDLGGGSFELQGRFVIGQNSAGTPTLCRFRASNQTIFAVDTPHALTDFTQVICDHASTRVEWNNISFVGLGTTNPGRVVVNVNNPVLVWAGGNCANWGITTLRSNSTITNVTWRSCALVTQNGATLTDCTFERPTGTGLLSNNPSSVSGCRFVSKGTGHGMEINTPGTYTFTDNEFEAFAGSNGSTGNEAVYNNSGGLVTINKSGGTAFSVRNGAGATTNVNDTVTLTIEANVSLVGAEVRIYDLDTTPPDYGTELAGTESHNAATYAYGGSSGNEIVVQIMLDGYEEFVHQTTVPSASGTFPVTLVKELNA